MNCYLYHATRLPMNTQMALDNLLFEKAQELSMPWLRIFYASEPWATVGYAGAKKAGYDLKNSDHEELASLPVARRITGGGTVIHGKDLIFSFCSARDFNLEKFKSVRVSYFYLHEAVQKAFKEMGFELDFYRADEDLPAGRDCFIYPVTTDLKYRGQKISGGAQKRTKGYFLHQESIQPPFDLDFHELEKALISAFSENFGLEYEPAHISKEMILQAEERAKELVIT